VLLGASRKLIGAHNKPAIPAEKEDGVWAPKHEGDWPARALQPTDFMKQCSDFQTMTLQTHGHVVMTLVESSSGRPISSTVLVGKNRFGNWVVREQNGMFGGLFASRTQALKYALCENGQHPEAILEVSREIELVFSHSQHEARGQ